MAKATAANHAILPFSLGKQIFFIRFLLVAVNGNQSTIKLLESILNTNSSIKITLKHKLFYYTFYC